MTQASPLRASVDTAVLDVDGTLVDSVYAHVSAWHEAFRLVGIDVPTWKIHRAIGMGGDRVVEATTHATVEHDVGDEVRNHHSRIYEELSSHLCPTPGAVDLIEALRKHGLVVVLASSASRHDTEAAVGLLGAGHLIDAAVTGDDSESSKPDTEPVQRAVRNVGGTQALVVGDSVWDMISARRAGYDAVGVLTGGVARCELLDAGAGSVYGDPAELAEALKHGPAAGR